MYTEVERRVAVLFVRFRSFSILFTVYARARMHYKIVACGGSMHARPVNGRFARASSLMSALSLVLFFSFFFSSCPREYGARACLRLYVVVIGVRQTGGSCGRGQLLGGDGIG